MSSLFQEDMIKTVKVKGNDVQVKSVTLKDETDCVKVSLWRNLSDSAAVGKFLSFTDVVVTISMMKFLSQQHQRQPFRYVLLNYYKFYLL